jgi:hypothetical protein
MQVGGVVVGDGGGGSQRHRRGEVRSRLRGGGREATAPGYCLLCQRLAVILGLEVWCGGAGQEWPGRIVPVPDGNVWIAAPIDRMRSVAVTIIIIIVGGA